MGVEFCDTKMVNLPGFIENVFPTLQIQMKEFQNSNPFGERTRQGAIMGNVWLPIVGSLLLQPE